MVADQAECLLHRHVGGFGDNALGLLDDDPARQRLLELVAEFRGIPDGALTGSGIDLSEDHRIAGEWKTAEGAAGHPATTQVLWRPDRSAASASEACTMARGEENGGTDE